MLCCIILNIPQKVSIRLDIEINACGWEDKKEWNRERGWPGFILFGELGCPKRHSLPKRYLFYLLARVLNLDITSWASHQMEKLWKELYLLAKWLYWAKGSPKEMLSVSASSTPTAVRVVPPCREIWAVFPKNHHVWAHRGMNIVFPTKHWVNGEPWLPALNQHQWRCQSRVSLKHDI